MSVTRHSEPFADHALSQKLAALGAPGGTLALDPSVSAKVLRKARSELRQPGEGTLSFRGLTLAWETALAPAVVLLAGAAYTVGAILQLIVIFG